MTPAPLFLSGRVDPVLCDCGEEIRLLYTLDLAVGGAFEYHIVGGELYAVAIWTQPALAVDEDSITVARPAQKLRGYQFHNPLHASAICSNPGCGSLQQYEFSFENGVVCGSRSRALPPSPDET
jgi:hypothetical protein